MKLSVPKKIVLIGASTGGPGQIQKIIESLPNLQDTALVIAQHMVDGFMESFTKRLQSISHNTISLVKDNQIFEHSNIYICEGETRLDRSAHRLFFTQKKSSINSFNPNIDILFNSFNPLCKDSKILSVILTGIGDDGVNACKNLSIDGARCVTESEQSAIVDGMPNRARAVVHNIEVYDMETIVKIISEFCE